MTEACQVGKSHPIDEFARQSHPHFDTHYYSGKRVGEPDAVVECDDGEILLFEVKSEVSHKTHASLDLLYKNVGTWQNYLYKNVEIHDNYL